MWEALPPRRSRLPGLLMLAGWLLIQSLLVEVALLAGSCTHRFSPRRSRPRAGCLQGDARLFVEGHYRLLDRLLREAASTGARDWAPGDAELEQVGLLNAGQLSAQL